MTPEHILNSNEEAESASNVLDSTPWLLVADDNPDNIELLGRLLKREYKVKAATRGDMALDMALNEGPFDLILLDVNMPGLSGFEVCEALKKEKATRSIPVIFITGLARMNEKVRGFNLGAVDFIAKPFDAPEVLARVKTHLQLKQARDTIEEYNKHLEQILEARTKELIRSERQSAFGQFVEGIVHNLRNPLTAIKGANQLLSFILDDYRKIENPSPEIKGELLDGITIEADRSTQMIDKACINLDEILNTLLVKDQSDKRTAMVKTDLNSLIKLEMDFLQADMRLKHGLKKNVDLSRYPLWIEVVPGEISQVFRHLVGNAVDALHSIKKRVLDIKTYKELGRAVVCITDNGPGVAPEIKDRVFEPFFSTKRPPDRADDESDEPSGSGLGLWMCRETLTSYNGTLLLNNRPEGGAQVIFTLPLI